MSDELLSGAVNDSAAPEQGAVVPTAKRGRKPGSGTKKAEVTLRLPVPTLADGKSNSGIRTTVCKKYDQIVLLTPDGKKVHGIIHHSTDKKAKLASLGASLGGFIFALIDGAMSGSGQGPDGSALYVHQHASTVRKAFPKIGGFRIKLVPAGRAGANAYEASIDDLVKVCTAKVPVITGSIKKHGAAAHKAVEPSTRADKGPSITF